MGERSGLAGNGVGVSLLMSGAGVTGESGSACTGI